MRSPAHRCENYCRKQYVRLHDSIRFIRTLMIQYCLCQGGSSTSTVHFPVVPPINALAIVVILLHGCLSHLQYMQARMETQLKNIANYMEKKELEFCGC